MPKHWCLTWPLELDCRQHQVLYPAPPSMNPLRAIHSAFALPLHRFDERTHAHVFHPQHLGLVDPFIGVDVFNMPHNFFTVGRLLGPTSNEN